MTPTILESKKKEFFERFGLIISVDNGNDTVENNEACTKFWRDEIWNWIETYINEERERIKTDLIKIADAGELEDLRREVEHYFTNFQPKDEK